MVPAPSVGELRSSPSQAAQLTRRQLASFIIPAHRLATVTQLRVLIAVLAMAASPYSTGRLALLFELFSCSALLRSNGYETRSGRLAAW